MIQITPEAEQHFNRIAEKDGVKDWIGVRVGVQGGGCSGFSYLLDFAHEERDGDLIFEGSTLKVYCDPRSHKLLDGMTLHFHGGLNGKGFVFENPNAESTCGCGSSFAA
jgi:iron-sulfur cluster assembly protein